MLVLQPVPLMLARMRRHLKHLYIPHSKAKQKASGTHIQDCAWTWIDDTLIFFVIKLSVVVRIQQGFILLGVTHMYQAGLQVYRLQR